MAFISFSVWGPRHGPSNSYGFNNVLHPGKINKEHNNGGLEDDSPFFKGMLLWVPLFMFKISPCLIKTCCIGTKQTARDPRSLKTITPHLQLVTRLFGLRKWPHVGGCFTFPQAHVWKISQNLIKISPVLSSSPFFGEFRRMLNHVVIMTTCIFYSCDFLR